MSEIDISINRFLTDYRQKSFIISANDQDFELAISSLHAGGKVTFYCIFKPVEYDHIIYMSTFTTSWSKARGLFKDITNQVVESYGVNVEDYPSLAAFIR